MGFSWSLSLQSYKRKPGRAEEERSTGDYNERINKRLRTVDSSEERSQKNKPSDGQQESDLYEHVREGEMDYDAQTYGLHEPADDLCRNVLLMRDCSVCCRCCQSGAAESDGAAEESQ